MGGPTAGQSRHRTGRAKSSGPSGGRCATFSRAAAAADRAAPEDWRQYSEKFRELGSPVYLGVDPPQNWQECCQEMAIGEIGRVLRNPCNQLNPQLFETDPDMKRLHEAFKGAAVRVLIGPIGNMSASSTEALETAEPS